MQQFADGLALAPFARHQLLPELLALEVDVRLVLQPQRFVEVGEVRHGQAGGFHELVELGDGVRAVLRMQERIHEVCVIRHGGLDLLAAPPSKHEVCRRQRAHRFLEVGDLVAQVRLALVDQAHEVLHCIHVGTPIAAVDHQPHAPVLAQHLGQRAQARIGICQVVQDTEAGDVVEAADPQPGGVQQGAMDPAHARFQSPCAGPLARDVQARLADVQVDDLGVGIFQLRGQENRGVARAATGNQRPESLAEIPPPAEHVVVNLSEDVGARQGETARTFRDRVARREWERFVEVAYLGVLRHWFSLANTHA
nr:MULTISPECIES: hypothetical protein [Ramlibacter]